MAEVDCPTWGAATPIPAVQKEAQPPIFPRLELRDGREEIVRCSAVQRAWANSAITFPAERSSDTDEASCASVHVNAWRLGTLRSVEYGTTENGRS